MSLQITQFSFQILHAKSKKSKKNMSYTAHYRPFRRTWLSSMQLLNISLDGRRSSPPNHTLHFTHLLAATNGSPCLFTTLTSGAPILGRRSITLCVPGHTGALVTGRGSLSWPLQAPSMMRPVLQTSSSLHSISIITTRLLSKNPVTPDFLIWRHALGRDGIHRRPKAKTQLPSPNYYIKKIKT
jgi:hypothetical protein